MNRAFFLSHRRELNGTQIGGFRITNTEQGMSNFERNRMTLRYSTFLVRYSILFFKPEVKNGCHWAFASGWRNMQEKPDANESIPLRICIVVLVLRRKPVHVLVLDRIAVDASTSTISLSTSTN
jgi:hypothetical protein